MQHLQYLAIDGDQKKFTKIPSEIFHLKKLKDLSLNGFSLNKKAFTQLKQLTNLEILSLNMKKDPKGLPSQIKHLTQLKELTLYYASELPTTIEELYTLKQLNLRFSKKGIKIPNQLLVWEQEGKLDIQRPS